VGGRLGFLFIALTQNSELGNSKEADMFSQTSGFNEHLTEGRGEEIKVHVANQIPKGEYSRAVSF